VGDDDYKPPEAKSVEELMAMKEGEDEALQRYKASLLGATAGAKTDDPRRVVITEVGIVPADHPPIMLDMTAQGPKKMVIKEGCSYRLQFGFRVQNELVSGLKYKHVVRVGSSREDCSARSKKLTASHSNTLSATSLAPGHSQGYQDGQSRGNARQLRAGSHKGVCAAY
jgi:hypothetical protein